MVNHIHVNVLISNIRKYLNASFKSCASLITLVAFNYNMQTPSVDSGLASHLTSMLPSESEGNILHYNFCQELLTCNTQYCNQDFIRKKISCM